MYDRVKAIPGDIPVTPKFQQEIAALSDKFENLKEFAPDLYKHQGLEQVKGSLATPQSPAHPNAYTASAIVDITKNLREKSNKILSKAEINDSEYHEAAALRAGATALENLLEDNLKARFPPGTPAVQSGRFLVDEWRKARQDLAKVYDVEGVANLRTGDVNPLKIAKLQEHGAPLTGNLKTIADAVEAMPEVFREPSYKAEKLPIHAGDVALAALAGGASVVSGNPVAMGALAARPLSQLAASSRTYQKMMAEPNLKPRSSIKMGDFAKGEITADIARRKEDEDTSR